MAFWGIEVKPGKPFTHACEKSRGRLHISQATLGISDAIKKSLVQCNVGKRSPVLLCALVPNNTESCHLDLEFEEADDVVFSVIGPRSVYLTGYYVHRNQLSNAHSDTESYGVDIENSHTEESSHNNDDDNYEDSFIDDGELQVSPLSPVSSGREMDEATLDSDMMPNKQGSCKQRKKKYQVSDSDSEDEDGYLLSVFKSKKSTKSTMPDDRKMSTPVIVQEGDITENGGICGSKTQPKVNPLDINGTPNRDTEMPLHNIETKVKDKKKKLLKKQETNDEAFADDEKVLTDYKIHGNKAEDIINRNLLVSCGEDQIQSVDVGPEISVKRQKKRKERPKNEKVGEDETSANPKTEKKKIKKKRTQGEGELDISVVNEKNMAGKYEDQTAKAVTIQGRTLPSGLIIEEVAHGPPNGKVAAPGKQVKIYYTAMLKESEHILESKVGKTAFKFLLGENEVIEGWNIGLDGMRVGDKRRLTIPPSMGYGEHGDGKTIPPNSWLVYDIELVSVRR